MKQIHFRAELFEHAWRIITETRDFSDVAKDLMTIQCTIEHGSVSEAASLDEYLRQKYPCIDDMLNTIDSTQIRPYSGNSYTTYQSLYKSRLK